LDNHGDVIVCKTLLFLHNKTNSLCAAIAKEDSATYAALLMCSELQ